MGRSIDSYVSNRCYLVVVCWRFVLNKYYQLNDEWFTYYVNIETGAKKFKLDKDDILIDHRPDDFWR